MTKTTTAVVAFIFGGLIGGGAAYYATRKYYEGIMDDEIASVKETYSKREVTTDKVKAEDRAEKSSEPVEEKPSAPDFLDYTKLYNVNRHRDDEVEIDPKDISVIDFAAFGTIDEYSTMTLIYYTDDIVSDFDDDEVIDNVSETIGVEWKRVFDKGEDVAYIRNNLRMCDYEILRSAKSYQDDVLPTKPPTLEERHDL